MKPHTLHRLYKAIMFVVLTGIVIFVYRTNPDFLKAPKAESSSSQNVSGFAWSGGATSNDGIGWISFNDTDCDTDANGYTDVACGGDNSNTVPSSYGVNINTTTGNFSGNAWSEHIGWVSFNRTATNNPPQNDPGFGAGAIAKVNTTTGAVTGWARAIAGCEMSAGVPVSGCPAPVLGPGSGPGAAAGGWDGWIKLSAEPADAVQYGVSISGTGQFSGHAWGGDILGWVDFNPKIDDITAIANPVHATFNACTPANVIPSGGSWGSCNEVADFCLDSVTNPPGTPIRRSQIGICGFGFTGTATQVCDPSTYTTYCPLPAANCGDNVCSGTETLLTCPRDCKSKVQQF